MTPWVRVPATKPNDLSFCPLNPHGVRQELTPESCPLTSRFVSWHSNMLAPGCKHTHVHTCVHTSAHAREISQNVIEKN